MSNNKQDLICFQSINFQLNLKEELTKTTLDIVKTDNEGINSLILNSLSLFLVEHTLLYMNMPVLTPLKTKFYSTLTQLVTEESNSNKIIFLYELKYIESSPTPWRIIL